MARRDSIKSRKEFLTVRSSWERNTWRSSRVATSTKAMQVGVLAKEERGQLVTLCCEVDAAGQSLPPVFVFPRVRFKDYFSRDGPLGSIGTVYPPDGWLATDFHGSWKILLNKSVSARLHVMQARINSEIIICFIILKSSLKNGVRTRVWATLICIPGFLNHMWSSSTKTGSVSEGDGSYAHSQIRQDWDRRRSDSSKADIQCICKRFSASVSEWRILSDGLRWLQAWPLSAEETESLRAGCLPADCSTVEPPTIYTWPINLIACPRWHLTQQSQLLSDPASRSRKLANRLPRSRFYGKAWMMLVISTLIQRI